MQTDNEQAQPAQICSEQASVPLQTTLLIIGAAGSSWHLGRQGTEKGEELTGNALDVGTTSCCFGDASAEDDWPTLCIATDHAGMRPCPRTTVDTERWNI